MSRFSCLLLILLSVVVSGVASKAEAGIIVPAGLKAGDTYHLAFVTDGARDAVSTDIAVYNAFVQAEAELSEAVTAGYGIKWFAVGSTPTVDARDNAFVSAPVYRLDGYRIADGYADMWDGNLDAPISRDQFLSSPSQSYAWTGSWPTGNRDQNHNALGGTTPWIGRYTATDGRWTIDSSAASGALFSMYAVSEELTVPQAVPEPSSWALLALGLAGIGAARFRRGRSTSRS